MLGSYEVFANLPAVDIARARKYYTEVVGMNLLMDMGDALVLEAGKGSKMYVYQRAATKADHTAASFVVDDVDAIVDGLIAKGVTFEQYDMGEIMTDKRGVATLGDMKAAWFKDSEGNILGITDYKG